MNRYIFGVVLLLIICCPLHSQSDPKTIKDAVEDEIEITDVVEESPTTKENVRQRIADALYKAKQTDFSLVHTLTSNPKLVLPLLQPYVHSDDDRVRSVVVSVAAAAQTPQALDTLTELVTPMPGSAGGEAVQAIVKNYNCRQIAQQAKLKSHLIEYLKNNALSTNTILLLSCFTEDSQIIDLLLEHRKRHGTEKTILIGALQNLVDVAFVIDVALAELGQKEAIQRIVGYVDRAKLDHIVFILDAIKFINSKSTLGRLVELLRDKREVRNVGFYYKPEYARVCDLALEALNYKSGASNRYDPLPEPYAERELLEAYRKYMALYNL